MKNPVIYAIWICEKVYIGSTTQFGVRSRVHERNLRAGKHKNRYLQSAWNKYGEQSFSINIIEYVSGDLLEREQYWIDYYADRRYNLCPIAGRSTGSKQSEETKAKRSAALKGRKRVFTAEWKQNIAAAQKLVIRNPLSEEHKEKVRLGNLGQKRSDETRSKMRAAWERRRNEKSAT